MKERVIYLLDNQTITIVQSTAPVLKQHSKEIGRRFYTLLFEKAPDLYNVFNQTNQKRGLQQEALGYAVYAAGEHITNLQDIQPVIERISQKHRAIGITPDQYPVVGETLLQAVKEVLGEAATDDILEAWGKAYGYISDSFISLEKKLYEETQQQYGGWLDYRDFIVDKKVQESETVTSFYLKAKDEGPLATYKAGQYLTLKAAIPGERYTHIRHYSLSDAPGKGYYRISVKREDEHDRSPEGIVSNYLHHQVQTGDTLSFSAPAGDFVLQENTRPLALISAGIGITPLLSMLYSLSEEKTGRKTVFIHTASNGSTHAFKEETEKLIAGSGSLSYFLSYTSPREEDREANAYDKEGYIDLPFLRSCLPDDAKETEYYLCGSIPFLENILSLLQDLEVPKGQIHYEVFRPVALLGE